MIINMTGGGGGAAMNFKVVPGLTQPGTASENTIWVKTERIGAWYFSATQPENMQEWDVWFPTGTESNVKFNALRKNGLQVYPLNAKQYVDGVLTDKETKSYQNGVWVDWATFYFKSGSGAKVPFTTRTGVSSLSISVGTDSIKIITSDNDSHFIFTKKPQDLTDKNTIYMRYKATSTQSGHTPNLVVNSNTFGQTEYSGLSGKTVLIVDSEEHTASVKVSALTGSFYIGTNGVANMEIYDIWSA